MINDPSIRPGDSFNIATEGIGTGEPISVATRGFLEPDLTVANIVIGGDGQVTVSFNPPTAGGIQTGGTAIIVTDLKTVYIYETSGGLVIGGDAYVQPFVEEGTGGVGTGGSADVVGPIVRSGMGAPRRRRQHVTPHHFIYDAKTKHLKVSGEAETDFVTSVSAGHIFVIKLDKVEIPIKRPTKPSFIPITKFLDTRKLDDLNQKPHTYLYRVTKPKKTISGGAEFAFISRFSEVIVNDEEFLLSLPFNNEYSIYESRYSNELKKQRNDDDEILLILGD